MMQEHKVEGFLEAVKAGKRPMIYRDPGTYSMVHAQHPREYATFLHLLSNAVEMSNTRHVPIYLCLLGCRDACTQTRAVARAMQRAHVWNDDLYVALVQEIEAIEDYEGQDFSTLLQLNYLPPEEASAYVRNADIIKYNSLRVRWLREYSDAILRGEVHLHASKLRK